MKFKKALSRVVGHRADELRILPAPTQDKEEDLTNSMVHHKKYPANIWMGFMEKFIQRIFVVHYLAFILGEGTHSCE